MKCHMIPLSVACASEAQSIISPKSAFLAGVMGFICRNIPQLKGGCDV